MRFSIFDCTTHARVSDESYRTAEEAKHDYHMNAGHTYVRTVDESEAEPAAEVKTRHNLTERELATVLHGLRTLQCGGRIEGCAAGMCEHFDDAEPLTDEEIDDLCERLNFGPDADEAGKPQVGTDSTQQGTQPEEQKGERCSYCGELFDNCECIDNGEGYLITKAQREQRRSVRCVDYCPHGYQGNPAACVDCKQERDTPPGTYVHQGTSEAHSPVRTASGDFFRYCALCRGWYYRHPWQVPANVAPSPDPIPENGEQMVRS